ncbi:MAG: hypothetical protein ACR2QK_21315 [Acidimicrobiales bacterium]
MKTITEQCEQREQRKQCDYRRLGRFTALLTMVCAVLAATAGGVSAEASPNTFQLIEKKNVQVVSPSSQDRINADVQFYLYTSNSGQDLIRARVEGVMTIYTSGCARMRVEYLDEDDNVIAAEHSEVVQKFSNGPTAVGYPVWEYSFNSDYRDMRLILQHDPDCLTVVFHDLDDDDSELTRKTVGIDLPVGDLGDPNVRVRGVKRSTSPTLSAGPASAENIKVRWDVVTNPASGVDRGDVKVTAKLNFWHAYYTGCARMTVNYFDSDGNWLDRGRRNDCDGNPSNITMPDFASDADLHRITVKVRGRQVDPITGAVKYFYSDVSSFELD